MTKTLVKGLTFIFGLCSAVTAAAWVPTQDTIKHTQIKSVASKEIKRYKLYGLNCGKCYRAIVRKVGKLPGVQDVWFNESNKVLVVVGGNYTFEQIRRICASEKQRIVR